MSIGIWINVVFFLGMGVCALVRPQFVVSFVKLVPETADARNEVRAVYGGFGIAIAVLLAVAALTYAPKFIAGPPNLPQPAAPAPVEAPKPEATA